MESTGRGLEIEADDEARVQRRDEVTTPGSHKRQEHLTVSEVPYLFELGLILGN